MTTKIAVVTATRAEYGLLSGLISQLEMNEHFECQLLVTGTHLSADYGLTINEIKQDGHQIAAQVPILDADARRANSDKEVAMITSRALSAFAEVFSQFKPDAVVVLGDRYELLGICSAALLLHIPIVHVHGGEVTEGAMDEAIRHAVTKMSSLHFVAAEPYRQRVIQMGEMPSTVFNTGALGVDNIQRMDLLAKSVLEKDLGINLQKEFLLVTFHPETWSENSDKGLTELCFALEKTGKAVIWTGANADSGGQVINQQVVEWFAKSRVKGGFFNSLGALRFLSLMRFAGAVVGNSSSGIIEAPAFKIPTVNIGQRQRGRLRTASIIDCDADEDSIFKAINKACDTEFRDAIAEQKCAYGAGNAARNMIQILLEADFKQLNHKPFYDVHVN